ncbi:TPA: hypothetical protein JBE46_05345 [Legionella pneumophila subsp. pneumophila]|uniref:protein-glutamine glutaminase family protein n=1 Tax=Legionella pneumophila TaxID=446 RepID=UPI0001E3C8F9|nr:protein-glutamine glutaminase family protein [Legionella pneumophila]MDC8030227.1 Gln-deamidase-2 domain-containing protein [Legionella pneumophila subsp. pneumophila]MDI0419113.1 protein-glutamine glutaminase family protein [Legionella pneumophila]MDI2037547.1 protein-glutamine glutaminase family protein [Legionella pneumophila]MDW8869815.1 protein-glutamine glutaminase family protein [Legionella pneumophila]MDW8915994.1 protein-glutamine glutaminase family protein [Legionella pneumophila]
MKKIAIILSLFPFLICCGLASATASQKRLPGESYQDAVKRIINNKPQNELKMLIARGTPYSKKVSLQKIDYSTVPKVSSYEELANMFNLIRDTRFLYSPDKPDFQRRISWLYPDDGCFARAALSRIKLDSEHFVIPAKIFVFGDLEMQTPYSSEGTVSWWYHVSAVVNYMGTIYVLDPAAKPEGPMLIDDWYNKIGIMDKMEAVVCNPYTYDPFDRCYDATNKTDNKALNDQLKYLDKEWVRIESLGFDPSVLLGDNPPWIGDMGNSTLLSYKS